MNTYPKLTRPREILSVLVEADSHHAVCGIEGLFYSISVMHINVDVEHPCVIAEGAVSDQEKTRVILITVEVQGYQVQCLHEATVSTEDTAQGGSVPLT